MKKKADSAVTINKKLKSSYCGWPFANCKKYATLMVAVMVLNLFIAFVIALVSWTQFLPTASASGRGFIEGHSAIESFIRASIQRFQIQEPLPGGYIQFTSNGRDLVNIYGSVK